jgi:hypothetical protein
MRLGACFRVFCMQEGVSGALRGAWPRSWTLGRFSGTHCLADAKTRLNEFVGLSTSGTLLALLGVLIGVVRRRQESPQLVLKVGSLYPAFPCREDSPALSAEQCAAAPITPSVPTNLRNPVIASAFGRPVPSCALVSVPKAPMNKYCATLAAWGTPWSPTAVKI